ncbi:MAG: nitronate monooxygenase [gamma proteobacterium symbiont of Bathyaustriella thionipta]|nr:nitronate monooxygenase [gamma proteobacterium symbiont of Bathyaustriella thionipta]
MTALGDPRWVVDKVKAAGGLVYHDVTCRRFAQKASDAGVDGFICVNNRAGGHAGNLSAAQLLEELQDFAKPMIAAGGIGSPDAFKQALASGYAGCQLGTRFIASEECSAHDHYKQAILQAGEKDIVLTERISGVPVSVINTAYIQRMGTRAGPLARRLLQGRKSKHWMRTFYALQSIWKLKQSSLRGAQYQNYFQAGKSVGGIQQIQSVKDIVMQYRNVLTSRDPL